MKHQPIAKSTGDALHWPGQVVTALELGRLLNGHRRLVVPAGAVLTPSALDELRRRGVAIERLQPVQPASTHTCWGVAQEKPDAAVATALQVLHKHGSALQNLPGPQNETPGRWARRLAELVVLGSCAGAVVFCAEPALICCVANKLAGLRAACVGATNTLGRLLQALAPNLVAVEMPGRSLFEVRQILAAVSAPRTCAADLSATLRELDGNAHR
jgi:hypothetical protein